MTVKDLCRALQDYNEDAEIILIDWCNGMEYDISIGSDDENEYIEKCSIGIV